jgi:hypothetical protein
VGGNRSGAEPATHAVVEIRSGDFLMTKISVAASIIAIAILAGPVSSLAQSRGGAASGRKDCVRSRRIEQISPQIFKNLS